MTLRLLQYYMSKEGEETENTVRTTPQKGYIANPVGRTAVIGSKVTGSWRMRVQERHVRKRRVKRDPPEPEGPPKKSSSNEKVSEKKCPYCNHVVQGDATGCPNCKTRFYKSSIACKEI